MKVDDYNLFLKVFSHEYGSNLEQIFLLKAYPVS